MVAAVSPAVSPAMSPAPRTAVRARRRRGRGRLAAVPRPVAGCVIATGAQGAGGRVAPAALAAPSLSGMGTGPMPVPRAG